MPDWDKVVFFFIFIPAGAFPDCLILIVEVKLSNFSEYDDPRGSHHLEGLFSPVSF